MSQHRLSRTHRHFRTAVAHAGVEGNDFAKAFRRRAEIHGAKRHDDDASRCVAESRRRHHVARRNSSRIIGGFAGMSEFRYQAVEENGTNVAGVIEADDRKSALRLLGQRGLFPSNLEINSANGALDNKTPKTQTGQPANFSFGHRIKRKDITALTREISALLAAAIPIPQALDSLGEEEENPALKAVVLKTADSVRKGASLSVSLEEHPQLFGKLYSSMVRVGEEGACCQRSWPPSRPARA